MKKNHEVIEKVAYSLGRNMRNDVIHFSFSVPKYKIEGRDQLVKTFLREVEELSGETKSLKKDEINKALGELICRFKIRNVVLWTDEKTQDYHLEEKLTKFGVGVISEKADKHELATCDLGITTCDYAISDTGTIALTTSKKKPRMVSLLPPIHLAIITPEDVVPSFDCVIDKIKTINYSVLISGPSRTADIELIPTLGVHGPKVLIVWMIYSAAISKKISGVYRREK